MELICGYMLSIRKFYDNGFGYGWFFASFFFVYIYIYLYFIFISTTLQSLTQPFLSLISFFNELLDHATKL